jgi:hypothetical protein
MAGMIDSAFFGDLPSGCEHVVALGRLLHAQVAPALQSMVSAHERDKRAGVTEQAVLPEVSCLLADPASTPTSVRRSWTPFWTPRGTLASPGAFVDRVVLSP